MRQRQGDRRQETGDREQETGDRETGDRRQRQETGDTGDRDRRQEIEGQRQERKGTQIILCRHQTQILSTAQSRPW